MLAPTRLMMFFSLKGSHDSFRLALGEFQPFGHFPYAEPGLPPDEFQDVLLRSCKIYTDI